jgi:hypothetical protein
MITVCGDFRQFLAIFVNFWRKNGVFNALIQFVHRPSGKKRQRFAKFYGKNIFKIITSIPSRIRKLITKQTCCCALERFGEWRSVN